MPTPGSVGAVERWDRLRGPVLAGAATVAVTALVHLVDPNEPGRYGLCPLRLLTGLACPLCGGLRAVHALTHGRADLAWGLNPAVVLLLPVVVVAWAWWTGRAWRGPVPRPSPRVRGALAAAALAGMVAFAVLRNLPALQPHLAALT